jgi:hypothetical protein
MHTHTGIAGRGEEEVDVAGKALIVTKALKLTARSYVLFFPPPCIP